MKKILISALLMLSAKNVVADQQHGMGNTYTSATLTIRKVLTLFTPEVLNGIDATGNLIEARIAKNNKLVISDIGCYDGFNSFETIKAAIKELRARYGSDFTIEVVYSDLAPTPCGFMKELLEKPSILGENVTTSYSTQNIFEVLPYQSDITICSYATHWLSEKIVAIEPLSSIFPTCFASQSIEKQKADSISVADIEKFYQARKKDTTIFVACVHMIKTEDQGLECTACATMLLMDEVFTELYKEGKIAQSDFYIPFAYRTSDQIVKSVQHAGCKVIANTALVMPSVFGELYANGTFSKTELGQWATKEARGWSEGSVRVLVGEKLVDEFYKRLEQKIQQDSLSYLSDHYIHFMITSAQ